jgi:hypothetical protein
MGAVSTIAGVTNEVVIAGSALSLITGAKALVSLTGKQGIGGLIFDLPETESLSLKAQITEHYVEDNTALQDHIAIAPKTITLTGKVAELALIKSELQKYAEQVIAKLSALGVLNPGMSQSAQKLLANYIAIEQQVIQTLAQVSDVATLFAGGATLNKQQKYYDQISWFFYSRGLYTVETPWCTLESMAIESVDFEQDESTKDWTSVSVTLKEIQVAKTKTTTGKIPTGRLEKQAESIAEKGKVSGKSLAAQGYDWLKPIVTSFLK